MRTVADGEAVAGISAVLMPGHTPGHTGWLVQSGRDGLLIWGDLIHLAAVQIARPDTGLVYDVDPLTACATRKRMLDRLAADKLRVAGAHMDFPGCGFVVRRGGGFGFEPDAYGRPEFSWKINPGTPALHAEPELLSRLARSDKSLREEAGRIKCRPRIAALHWRSDRAPIIKAG